MVGLERSCRESGSHRPPQGRGRGRGRRRAPKKKKGEIQKVVVWRPYPVFLPHKMAAAISRGSASHLMCRGCKGRTSCFFHAVRVHACGSRRQRNQNMDWLSFWDSAKTESWGRRAHPSVQGMCVCVCVCTSAQNERSLRLCSSE